jgi:hypothetical protein
MNVCRCTSLEDAEHLNRICDKLATEPDGYCKACHDHHVRRESQRSEAAKNVRAGQRPPAQR